MPTTMLARNSDRSNTIALLPYFATHPNRANPLLLPLTLPALSLVRIEGSRTALSWALNAEAANLLAYHWSSECTSICPSNGKVLLKRNGSKDLCWRFGLSWEPNTCLPMHFATFNFVNCRRAIGVKPAVNVCISMEPNRSGYEIF